MNQLITKRNVPGLGARINAGRRALGLSQHLLSARAGISVNRLRDAERYDAATAETINRLAKVLMVPADELLGRKRAARAEEGGER